MKIQSNDINFKAGLTQQMRREIAATDVAKVAAYFDKHGIQNDFNGNKVVAWCSLKVFEIMRTLRLGLPKGIFVEDFNLLRVKDNSAIGLTNHAPCRFYKNSDCVVPEKTIFFNSISEEKHLWDDIDSIADKNFEAKLSPTDFFLELFIHEFSHVIHENHLIQKLGKKEALSKISNALDPYFLESFAAKNRKFLNEICLYASTNPFEAVACDFSRRVVHGLDKDSLTLQKNIIKTSPYRMHTIFSPPLDALSEKLHNFWNGKFYD